MAFQLKKRDKIYLLIKVQKQEKKVRNLIILKSNHFYQSKKRNY